jgi:SAM-dependent methyltransferase
VSGCRFCRAPLSEVFVDLGLLPLPNVYVRPEEADEQHLYPLLAYVCERCFLVQVDEVATPETIFGDYAYFSSYSDSMLAHAREYARGMRVRLRLDASSQVIEIASNDGYLLQYFLEEGIPVLGIEPAGNVAAFARTKGIETLCRFFGAATALELIHPADLLIANNVLAHVPDLNDFVAGLRIALAPAGTLTIEFPHLMQLIEQHQFDTIYHEHFSYLSLLTVRALFDAHELRVVDVEELSTHGGSLRVHVRHDGDVSPAVEQLIERERAAGLDSMETYRQFAGRVRETRESLRAFVATAKGAGKRIAGYGAPAKASTLLNYCGIGAESIDYTVDRSPHKQGRLVPGTRIPIHAPEMLAQTRPDYVLVLPWNLRDEILAQLAYVREWGGRLVIPVPRVEVLE